MHRQVQARHGSFVYNPNDIRIGRSLEIYGEWAESEFEIYAQVLRPGDTVIDVGAYIGTHAVYFAKTVGSSGAVHAIEPQLEMGNLLTKNCGYNSISNITLHRAAAGADTQTLQMPKADYGEPGDFGSLKPTEGSGDPVPQIMLDSLPLEKTRLLKIDVDGGELAVLLGARSLISRAKPIIFVENNNAATSAELIETLLELEYALYWHLDFLFNEANFFAREGDIFNGSFDANVFAIPRSLKTKLTNFTAVTGPTDTWKEAVARSKKATQ